MSLTCKIPGSSINPAATDVLRFFGGVGSPIVDRFLSVASILANQTGSQSFHSAEKNTNSKKL